MTRRDQPEIPHPLRAQPTIDHLRNLTRITVRDAKGKNVTGTHRASSDLTTALASFARHLDIARDHPSRPDGYPTRASGADSGGGGNGELTAVEAAVVALDTHRDDHDWRTAILWGHVQIATAAIAALVQGVKRLDLESTPTNGLGLQDDRWCANHLRHNRTVARDTRRGTKACAWCQSFKEDVGDWPTAALIEKHDAGHRIYDRDIRDEFPDYGKAPA